MKVTGHRSYAHNNYKNKTQGSNKTLIIFIVVPVMTLHTYIWPSIFHCDLEKRRHCVDEKLPLKRSLLVGSCVATEIVITAFCIFSDVYSTGTDHTYHSYRRYFQRND